MLDLASDAAAHRRTAAAATAALEAASSASHDEVCRANKGGRATAFFCTFLVMQRLDPSLKGNSVRVRTKTCRRL